jgi:hypothetical protein
VCVCVCVRVCACVRACDSHTVTQSVAPLSPLTSRYHEMGAIIGRELRALWLVGATEASSWSGKPHAGLDCWSPNININRDPRCARTHSLTQSLILSSAHLFLRTCRRMHHTGVIGARVAPASARVYAHVRVHMHSTSPSICTSNSLLVTHARSSDLCVYPPPPAPPHTHLHTGGVATRKSRLRIHTSTAFSGLNTHWAFRRVPTLVTRRLVCH